MAIYRGNNEITKIYRGNTEIQNVYRGNNLIYSNSLDTDSFIITIKTDNSGASNNNQFTSPCLGTYDVDWGDGNVDIGITGHQTHTYTSTGVYDVKFSNTFTNYDFRNSGDSDKLIGIKQYGTSQLTTMNQAFFNCRSSITVTATDTPDLSNLTIMSSCFLNADGFNSPINNWDVSSVTEMRAMFNSNNGFDQDISSWDISNVSDFTGFMSNNIGGFSTINYDLLLVGWEATLQATYPGGAGYPHTISISFGNTNYTLGGAAETARTSLINNFGWTITDGGGI